MAEEKKEKITRDQAVELAASLITLGRSDHEIKSQLAADGFSGDNARAAILRDARKQIGDREEESEIYLRRLIVRRLEAIYSEAMIRSRFREALRATEVLAMYLGVPPLARDKNGRALGSDRPFAHLNDAELDAYIDQQLEQTGRSEYLV